jgi:hypothetical protein
MRLDDVLAGLEALERRGVRYAVFGGLAMAAYGFDRATRDLDLFVASDADNVELLRRSLADVFDDPDIAQITAEDLGGEYPAIQYGPPATLYRMKRDTVRLRDRDDAQRLARAFDLGAGLGADGEG